MAALQGIGLQGKIVLVTGASRGIGAAAAAALHAGGARVLLHATAPSRAAEEAAASAGQRAADVLYEDLAAPGAGARLVAAAIADRANRVFRKRCEGRIDIGDSQGAGESQS